MKAERASPTDPNYKKRERKFYGRKKTLPDGNMHLHEVPEMWTMWIHIKPFYSFHVIILKR